MNELPIIPNTPRHAAERGNTNSNLRLRKRISQDSTTYPDGDNLGLEKIDFS
jgi:hypothetical protein